MTDHNSMLCVGGPLAGRRFAAKKGAGFVVPTTDAHTSWTDTGAPDYQPNAAVSVELTRYRSDVFHTPQGDVSFWTPEGQTALETITLLLETYEEARIIADGVHRREKRNEQNATSLQND